jgi:hypothetical protein
MTWLHCSLLSMSSQMAKLFMMWRASKHPPCRTPVNSTVCMCYADVLPPCHTLPAPFVIQLYLVSCAAWCRYIRLFVANDVLVHFKSLDSGKMNGLVTSVVYRNPEFRQQWLFKAIGMGAKGQTAKSLVDECQVWGPVIMPASAAKTNVVHIRRFFVYIRMQQSCTHLEQLTYYLIQDILAAMNGDTTHVRLKTPNLNYLSSGTPAPSSPSSNSCCTIS